MPKLLCRWLLLVFIFLNSTEFLFEIVGSPHPPICGISNTGLAQILDWFSPAYVGLTSPSKLVNMYFQVQSTLLGCSANFLIVHRQTISIRAAGFNSVNITQLNTALLWLYAGDCNQTCASPFLKEALTSVTCRYDVYLRHSSCHRCALHGHQQSSRNRHKYLRQKRGNSVRIVDVTALVYRAWNPHEQYSRGAGAEHLH